MTKLILFTVSALALFISADCKKDIVEPPPTVTPVNPLKLTVDDVTCTEAWLKISLAESEPNRTLILKRTSGLQKENWDSVTVLMSITVSGKDTLVLDTLLLPNKTYTYAVIKPAQEKLQEWSATAQVTTMDTTSSNWSWTVEKLGVSQSYLHDVAIINDTLAYAVGELYLNDSLGNFDNTPYNLAMWDGKKWKLKRVFINHRGSVGVPILDGIFAFSPTDIWFVGGSPIHGDGTNWTYYDVRAILGKDSIAVYKAWGSSSTDIYFVGWRGNIIHYNGTSWRKIESGTATMLNDVWGGSNKWLGENIVLVTVGNFGARGDLRLLRIRNGFAVDSLPMPLRYTEEARLIYSTWFNQNSPIYISGSGVFKLKQNKEWRKENIPLLFTYHIRGNGMNDIIAAGTQGFITHFNGMRWNTQDSPKLSFSEYKSVAIKGNMVIAVGWLGNIGVVAVGKR